MSTAFITVAELQTLSGVTYTGDHLGRVEAMLPLVSDLIRNEGKKYNIDVDAKFESDPSYQSVVKLVTCDVTTRAMRQSTTGDPLSQESQSGLGYTWSGTYAIPGGGIAMSLLDRERKMLGFRRQQYGVMMLWDGSEEEQ